MSTVEPDLSGRHFLTMTDYSADEIRYLIDLSAELKAAKREGREQQRLAGKEIALIFEKDSTRTRCAFEVAAYDQGAHVTFIGPSGSHMGHKETVKDTARVLGRMYDAIEYRGFGEAVADELAQWAGVPVYNGLTDEWHPTQMLADYLTMREHLDKPYTQMRYCYLGDARFNMANSYLAIGGQAGHGRPDRRAALAVARRGPGPDLRGLRRRVRRARSRSPRTSPRPSAAVTFCSPTYGSPWASPPTSGPSASSCSCPTRSTRRRWR